MTVKMYSIFDKVSKKSGPIQICENEQEAQRMYKMSVNGVPEEFLNDFKLVYLGDFDVSECKISSVYVEKLDVSDCPDQKELFENEVING